jgi:hypothetical protein
MAERYGNHKRGPKMIRGPILKLLSMLTAQDATQAETDRASRALERLWAERAEQLLNYCTADELVLLSSIVHFYCEHRRAPTLQEFQGLAEEYALNGSKLRLTYLHECHAEQCLSELSKLQDLAPLLRLSTLSTVIEEIYKELLR